MRADRLIALVLLLQRRGRLTAAQVADELEVSVPTARRDLEALMAAGVPLFVQPGRGGGWQLVGGARTDLTGLSSHDARALFWMLGTAGFESPDTRVATMKLIEALPAPLRQEANQLATSIHYDHAPWGVDPTDAQLGLDDLREAIVRQRAVTALVAHRRGEPTRERLHPLGLVAKAGVWYLVVEEAPGTRIHRVDRLTEVLVTDEQPRTPQGFDLPTVWREHAEQVEALRSGVAARLRVPHWAVPVLSQQFGRYFTGPGDVGGANAVPGAAGVVVEVRSHLMVGLAEQLAGWGSTVEVLDPPELRGELARIGAELVARHGQ